MPTSCADRDAGAVDQDAGRSDRLRGLGDSRFGALGAAHVATQRNAADRARDALRALQPDIEHGDARAFCRERPCRRLAKARTRAGDDRRLSANIHSWISSCLSFLTVKAWPASRNAWLAMKDNQRMSS